MSFGHGDCSSVFGKCQNCDDPVKRWNGRLCSSCWWAAKRKRKRQAKNEGELPPGSGANASIIRRCHRALNQPRLFAELLVGQFCN